MFILLDNKKPINQNLEIFPLLNQIGFINVNQYYNHLKKKTKKFNHLFKEHGGRYEIISINQNEFFQDNMLHYPNLLS